MPLCAAGERDQYYLPHLVPSTLVHTHTSSRRIPLILQTRRVERLLKTSRIVEGPSCKISVFKRTLHLKWAWCVLRLEGPASLSSPLQGIPLICLKGPRISFKLHSLSLSCHPQADGASSAGRRQQVLRDRDPPRCIFIPYFHPQWHCSSLSPSSPPRSLSLGKAGPHVFIN